MAKYRKRPVVIEAVQLRWDTWSEMCEFAGVGKLSDGKPEGTRVDANNLPVEGSGDGRIALAIPTLEGVMVGVENDWIIRGIKGELYPCKPDIFAASYEPADTPAKPALDVDALHEAIDRARSRAFDDTGGDATTGESVDAVLAELRRQGVIA